MTLETTKRAGGLLCLAQGQTQTRLFKCKSIQLLLVIFWYFLIITKADFFFLRLPSTCTFFFAFKCQFLFNSLSVHVPEEPCISERSGLTKWVFFFTTFHCLKHLQNTEQNCWVTSKGEKNIKTTSCVSVVTSFGDFAGAGLRCLWGGGVCSIIDQLDLRQDDRETDSGRTFYLRLRKTSQAFHCHWQYYSLAEGEAADVKRQNWFVHCCSLKHRSFFPQSPWQHEQVHRSGSRGQTLFLKQSGRHDEEDK